ncbi:DUF4352 domain-containing protein [Alkalihalobacillus sp. NPDC078783]
MKKVLFTIGLSSIVALAACGTEDDSSTGASKVEKDDTETEEVAADTEENTDDAETEEEEVEPEELIFAVGDTVDLGDGREVTITSAGYTDPAEYGEPDNGKVLTIEMTVDNQSDDSFFIDNTDFTLSDENGSVMDQYYSYDEMAISEDIPKGKNKAGKLYFDVAESSEFELQFEDTWTWDETEPVIWIFQP